MLRSFVLKLALDVMEWNHQAKESFQGKYYECVKIR